MSLGPKKRNEPNQTAFRQGRNALGEKKIEKNMTKSKIFGRGGERAGLGRLTGIEKDNSW